MVSCVFGRTKPFESIASVKVSWRSGVKICKLDAVLEGNNAMRNFYFSI